MKTAHESAALSGENIPLPIRYRLRLLPLRMFNGGLLGVFLGTIFALSFHFGGSFFSSASATPTGDPVPIPPASPPQTVPLYPSSVDLDGDGIPNVWETQFHHNPESAADAGSDFDNDGLTTRQEYDLSRRTNGTSGNPLGQWRIESRTPPAELAGWSCYPVSINNLGDVLINCNENNPINNRSYWIDVNNSWVRVTSQSNPTTRYDGYDINDQRQVVGISYSPNLSSLKGFIWKQGSDPVDLICEGKPAYACRINNHGDWIGAVQTVPGEWKGAFVVNNTNQVHVLDSWPLVWFTDINDSGMAIGTYTSPDDGKDHTFLACPYFGDPYWRYDTGYLGAKPEFDDLTNLYFYLSAMNQWGEFTGSSGGQSDENDEYRAFHFDGGFHKVDIVSPGADSIAPLAISEDSTIVGYAETWTTLSFDAFIFRDGVGVRLHQLRDDLPVCDGRYTTINDSRMIATRADESGEILIITPDQDADGDGMANDWEVFYGLDPANETDAYLDPDGDGINNLGEYSLRFSPGQYNPRSDDGRFIDTGPGVDDDEDGIPNIWEWQNGLDYEDPIDALQDPDRDGFSSLQEYQLNTNPHGAPTYRIREIGPFPNANSAITTLAKLGSGLDAESCLGPQEGTLMESVFFPASPLGSWDQRPAAWSLRRSEVQGSLDFYKTNSSQLSVAVAASGAAISTNGGSAPSLTYWGSQAADSVNLLAGLNVNEVRKFEAVSLSPAGTWAAGWRTRNSITGEVEAVRWKMPSGGSTFQPVVLPLTATSGPTFTLPINTPLFVNDHGSVTATARLGTSNRAVLWHSGSVFVLPTLGGLWSAAVGLSNDAVDPIVAGNSVLLNGQQRATAWTTSDSASDLGTLENGNYSAVTGIAPSGLISAISHVVEADLPSRYKTFIAKYVRPSEGPEYWKVFPQGGSASSILHTSITDAAEILGSTAELGQAEVPTLWRLGRAYPLNSVLPPSSGYHLVSFKTLNSNSTLLATVNKDGVEGQILLTPDPDTDGDGLPDAFENRHKLSAYTSQPPQTDTDGDDLTDLAEFAAGTDPCLKDSDTDGMFDGWEISWGFNPLDAYDAALDTDGDHVSNLREFQLLTNPVGLYRLETPKLSTGETFHSITPAGSLVTLAPGTNGTVVLLRHADKAYANEESEVLNDFALMSITEPSGGLVIRDELCEGAWNWSAIWGIGPGFVRLADSLQADQETRPFTQNSLGDIIMSASGGLGAPPGFVEGFATGTDNSIIELQEFSANISTTLSPNGRFGLFTVYDASLPFDPTYSMFGVRRNEVIDTLGNSSILPFAPQIQVEQDPVDTNEDGEPDYYPPPIMEYIGAPFNWTALNNNGDAVGIQPGGGFVTCAAGLHEPQIFAWTAEISDRFAINSQVGYLPDRSFVVDSDDMWMPSYRINVAGSVMEATRIRKPGLSPWERIISFTENGLALGAGTEPFLVLNGTTVRFSQLRTFRPEDTTAVLPLKDQPGMPVLNPVRISKGGKIVATTAVGTVFYLIPDNDLNKNGISDDFELDVMTGLTERPSSIDLSKDYDGDGFTLLEEWRFGSSDADYRSSPSFSMDDDEGDDDKDGISNCEDADPSNEIINWRKGPRPTFVARIVKDVPDMNTNNLEFVDFSEEGQILLGSPATHYPSFSPLRTFVVASIKESSTILKSLGDKQYELNLPGQPKEKPTHMSTPHFNGEVPVAGIAFYGSSDGDENPTDIWQAGLLSWDNSGDFLLDGDTLTDGRHDWFNPSDHGVFRNSYIDGSGSFSTYNLEIPGENNWWISLYSPGAISSCKLANSGIGLAARVFAGPTPTDGIAVWRCQDNEGILNAYFPGEALSGLNAYHEFTVDGGSQRELLITYGSGLQVAADGHDFMPAGLWFPTNKGISDQGWIAESDSLDGPCLWWGGKHTNINSFIEKIALEDRDVAVEDFVVTEIHEMNSSGAICVSAYIRSEEPSKIRLYVLLPYEISTDSDTDSGGGGCSELAPDDFRQIALNGRPKVENSPQDKAEIDMVAEHTSIDALTRTLRHDTTHVFVPIPASDLALQVTMSVSNQPVTIPTARGMAQAQLSTTPSAKTPRFETINRALALAVETAVARESGPFGMGMTSNLGAKVEIQPIFRKFTAEETIPPEVASARNPRVFSHYKVVVPDESGALFEFTSKDLQSFFPVRSLVPRPIEILTTLTRKSLPADRLILTKKFGTTVAYTWIGSTPPSIPPAFNFSDPLRLNVSNYQARVESVSDRYGNMLNYTYSNPAAFIPSKISVAGRTNTSITINSSSHVMAPGHLPFDVIDSVTDPRGYSTTFTYRPQRFCNGYIPVLDTVTKPDLSSVRYRFDDRIATPVRRQEGYLRPHLVDEFGELGDQARINNIKIQDVSRRALNINDDHLNSINVHLNLASIEDALGNRYSFEYESSLKSDLVKAQVRVFLARKHPQIKDEDVDDLLADEQDRMIAQFDQSFTVERDGHRVVEFVTNNGETMVSSDTTTLIYETTASGGSDAVTKVHLPGNGGEVTFANEMPERPELIPGQFTVGYGFPGAGPSLRPMDNVTIVTDAEHKRTRYEFSDVFQFISPSGQYSGQLRTLHSDGNSATKLIRTDGFAYTTLKISDELAIKKTLGHHAAKYYFSLEAGLSLSKTKDVNGHTVVYEYRDEIPPPKNEDPCPSRFTAVRAYFKRLSFDEQSGSPVETAVFAKFNDPNVEIRVHQNDEDELDSSGGAALNLTLLPNSVFTRYEFDQESRLMKSSVDPRGNETVTTLRESTFNGKSTKRRTDTMIYQGPASANDLRSHTHYEYSDTFHAFVTSETITKIPPPQGGVPDPKWVADRATKYEPDNAGRVAITHLDPPTLSVPAPLALDLITTTTYDNAGNKVSAKDPKGNTIAFTYDSVGHLSKVTYPDGTCKTYGYDLAGRKIRESDELGRATLWEYDPLGRPLKVAWDMNGNQRIDATDLVTTTTYSKVGRPLTVTDPNGNLSRTFYDDLHRPWKIENALHYESFLDYSGPNSGSGLLNGAGYQPTRTLDARGFVAETTYDAFYRPVKVGKEYELPSNGDWTTRTLDSASRSDTDYDANGNPTETRSFRNADDDEAFSVTTTTYDALNRPFLTTSAVGTPQEHTTETQFTSTGLAWKNIAFKRSSLERHTETEYDAAGRVTVVWTPSPLDGKVTASAGIGPNAPAKTAFLYDKSGNQTEIRKFWGVGENDYHVTTTDYDSRNRPTLVTSPEEKTYSITNPNTGFDKSATTKTLYDDAGNPWMTISPRGAVTITEYDNANRPWQITTGLKEDENKPNGYDADFAAVTENTYDKNGNIVAVKDANENITRNQYDALNRLTATATNPNSGKPSANFGNTAADDIVVANQYDAGGNLVAVADGEAVKSYNASTQSWLFSGSSGHVTGFDYDGLGRKISQTWDAESAVAKPEYWNYDALVLESHEDARNVISTHDYDALLRPVSVTFSDPSEYADPARDNLSYTYAGSNLPGDSGPGPLVSVSYPGDTPANQTLRNVSYTHDFLDRQLTETSAGVTHIYGYDVLGNRVLVVYGDTGRSLVSDYDALNRVTTITDANSVTSYKYDVAGGTVFLDHANGTSTSNQYDLLGRLKYTATSLGGAVLSACDYSQVAGAGLPSGYDKLGNVCHVVETYANLQSRTVVNTYDKANRLKTEALGTSVLPPAEFTPTEVTTYLYDKANNRTKKTTTGGANPGIETSTYGIPADGYNTNQLMSVSRGVGATLTTFLYDANGNRSAKLISDVPTQTYTYDALNRLIALSDATRGTFTYRYDYRTRRVQRDEFAGGGTTTRLSFSGGSYVQTYVDTDTQPTTELIRGNELGGGIGGLLYTVEGGAATHNLYNSRGDVISQASATGSVTWEAQYEAFGTRKAETPGTAVGRQKANTKDEDPTGLLNEGFRYRDMESGVFLTRDPMGFVDGPNVYTYVRQNPWTYYDPEGLFIDTIWDVANVLYDGGAIAWNIGATIGGGAVSMIGAATGNKFIEEAGAQEVTQAMRNLGNSAVDVGTDAFAALVPFAPAGASKVVRATDKTLDAVDAAKDGKKLVDKGKDAVDSARSIEKKSEAAVESATDAAKNIPNDVVPSISKRAALRKAKRDAGIPTSQTHLTHKPNQSTTKTPGGPLDSRDATIYKFEGGKEVQLHPTGHKFKDGSVYDKPHFNNHNNGASSTSNHYEWDK